MSSPDGKFCSVLWGGSQHQERAKGVFPGVVFWKELTGSLKDSQTRPRWILGAVGQAVHLVRAAREEEDGCLGSGTVISVGCLVQMADCPHGSLAQLVGRPLCWEDDPLASGEVMFEILAG